MVTTTSRFDFKMYQAALTYYGLPTGYTRTFKQILLTDKDTSEPILDKDGKQKTTLVSCHAPKESLQGNAVWIQINKPFDGAAIKTTERGHSYPKKAKNSEIEVIQNISLDFEYPTAPHLSHEICYTLMEYLIAQGLAEEGQSGEDTGGGNHISIPIIPIITTPETADLWNTAVATVIKTYVKPEFDRLCQIAGIGMDFSGFDISRVLSIPGTWRPYNPDKNDCEALKQGYLRKWLAPYTDGSYPVRKENAKLSQLIRDTFEHLRDVPQPTQKGFVAQPAQWLRDYAARHPNNDRSALFQALVSATYLRYGENTVFDLQDTINIISGEKYNGRLEYEIKRSLALAQQLPRQDRWQKRQDSMDWKAKSYGHEPDLEDEYYNDAPVQPPLETVLERMAENEWGDALLFAEIFQDRAVYDASGKEWYHWNEHYWKLDSTNYIRQLVSGHLGSVYYKAAAEVNVKWAEIEVEISKLPKGSDKVELLRTEQMKLNDQMEALRKRCYSLRAAKRCLAVLGFVQTDPRMAITGDYWDKDKWALPVLNGIINLRTGLLRPGKPRDYIRTVSPVIWDGIDVACSRFERFLNEIFEDRPEDERQELIAFLQRLLGYAITGLSEKAIFPILYGKEGRNGKDTLLSIIKLILGALAGAASNDLFIDSKAARSAGSATPHICDLQGKRVVWGSETKQGDKLNIAQIKLFTGGGDLSARQLHGKQFSFSPTHTLLLMTNHRPHADADEEAFWARACLIQFKMRFLEPDEVQGEYDRPQDETLKSTLLQELSGILAWLVRGCLDWQKIGFSQPASVRMATADYRKSEDRIQQFIDEHCYVDPKCFVKAEQIYKTYKAWCFENNHNAMNNTLFGEKFGSRFQRERRKYGKVYVGVGLIDFNTPDPSNTTDKGVYHHTPGVYPDGNYTPTSEPASEQASKGYTNDPGCIGVYENEVLPPIDPRESDLGPKVEKCIHPIHPGGSDTPLEPLVEPAQDRVYSRPQVYTSHTPVYTQGVPEKHKELFEEYREKVLNNPVTTVIWCALDSDYKNTYFPREQHVEYTRSLLRSDEGRKVNAALEAMMRTLGTWEVR